MVMTYGPYFSALSPDGDVVQWLRYTFRENTMFMLRDYTIIIIKFQFRIQKKPSFLS